MVGPQRELDRFLFDKKEKKEKNGGEQDDCPRPFVKGSVSPAECWTFPMHRNKVCS